MFGGKESGSPASSPLATSPASGQGLDSSAPALEIPNTKKDILADQLTSASPISTTFSSSPALSTISNTEGPALMPKDKRSNSNASTASRPSASGTSAPGEEKKRRSSSSVGAKASAFLASAKNSLQFSPSPHSVGFGKSSASAEAMQTPLQKLGRQDPALSVPQGQHNNSAGESLPGPRSTFRVGVWEDKNKKCRRTMEDTHAFLYNFLHTPAPKVDSGKTTPSSKSKDEEAPKPKTLAEAAAASDSSVQSQNSASSNSDMMETDNGYFAIFDGHAGTFAADWCGKKLHIILEEMIRANPNTPIPELLDLTFTNVDRQLEKLPLKNSGCTAVCAVLRWEDRIPNAQSATGSTAIAPATAAAVKAQEEEQRKEEKASKQSKVKDAEEVSNSSQVSLQETQARLKQQSTRQRVLYTANVGDARIVLCRNGKALRLSYDHKGSDENEGKRVANAGGLILNNRVNGVLAVTRALGDAYMKDLVTGHPYTTETVVQCGEKGEGGDEFIILACDGLWDVCSDQEAVDLVRHIQDPVTASKALVDHALARFSTDNLSCMIVRLNKVALADTFNNHSTNAIGVEGDPVGGPGTQSEADKIVNEARRKVDEEGAQVGVSGSNSGKGHEPTLEAKVGKIVEEEPHLTEGGGREVGVGKVRGKKEKGVSPTRSTRSLNIFRKASPGGSPPKQ